MDRVLAALPPLRDDIVLAPGPMDDNGWPTYTLHDPVRHRFFRLGWREFEILVRWGNSSSELLGRLTSETALSVGETHIHQMLAFLSRHGLLKISSDTPPPAELQKPHWLLWLLHHYLFFRIPLVRPEPWLKRLAPKCSVFFRRPFWIATGIAGLAGLFLAVRQWESFHATFIYLFSLEGMIWYGLTLSAAKLLHEFGHAVTLRRLGGQVPTMGVAFLVLWPMLYTETSSSWLLRSRKDRLAVGVAGILIELAVAAWALMLWGLMPDGPARMAAYLLATITLVGTLAVNASPLMRFDGYYLLSDFFGIANLQERGFALIKWRMRQLLLGIDEPPPETLPWKREAIFLLWSASAWVYRFFLFLGIALLVYHMAFKALGILLMAVEIGWFIVMPIGGEIKEWWHRRKKLAWNSRNVTSALFATLVFFLVLMPWRSSVEAPAILQAAQRQTIYASYNSRITAINIIEGQDVRAGDVLLEVEAPDLTYKQELSSLTAREMAWRLERSGTNAAYLEERRVAVSGLESAMAEQRGVSSLLSQGRLAAPFAGRILEINDTLSIGRWVGQEEQLLLLAGFTGDGIEALLRESDLARISVGATALFIPEDASISSISAKVEAIDAASLKKLEAPYLASVFGGSIAVDEAPGTGHLIPREPVFRIRLKPLGNVILPPRAIRGTVHIDAERRSILLGTLAYTLSVLQRESGF
jgi:putative peptide zinc metalloprotease protein